MRARVEKPQASSGKAAAVPPRQLVGAKATTAFEDHRPTAIAQRKLQQAISSKVQAGKAPVAQQSAQPRSLPAGQAPVQRTEAAAIAVARNYDNTINDWNDVLTRRGVGGVGAPATVIDSHWQEIITAYVAPPAGGRTATDLIAEAQALVARGEWAVLQRIKEASELLAQLQKEKAARKALFLARGPNGAQVTTVHQQVALHNEISAIETEIASLQTHFMMPTIREKKGGTVSTGLFSSKQTTVLSFAGGVHAELYNSINPDTGKTQSLGKGGFGYGRFGRVNGEAKFVKKIRLRTEANMAMMNGDIKDPYAQSADLASFMSNGQSQELRSLRREAELTRVGGVLDHPNILTTEAAGIRPGKDGKLKAYMVMEKMAGDVPGLIKARAVDRGQAIRIIRGTLSAVNHMHTSNYLHRDIKPENIMLDAQGEPKLIDFGTAAVMVGGEYVSQTAEGTRTHMHPSVNVSPMPVGGYRYRASTDIHALKLTFNSLVKDVPALADISAWVDAIDTENTTVAALLASFNF